jgi:hypothetical protein
MRDCAARIAIGNRLKHFGRFREPEGMQQRDGLVEVGLHGWRTGGLKVHAGAADLIRRHRTVIFMLRASSSRQRERTDANENGHELAFHRGLLEQADIAKAACPPKR